VLHTHSVANTVLSRAAGNSITLAQYELLKALPGFTTHDAEISIPVLDNTQDIPAMAAELAEILAARPELPLFLIRGHGLYGWAADMNGAKKVVEATEFMLSCALAHAQIRS
jgi:methylthioribulose-1-phosphate dehydratase